MYTLYSFLSCCALLILKHPVKESFIYWVLNYNIYSNGFHHKTMLRNVYMRNFINKILFVCFLNWYLFNLYLWCEISFKMSTYLKQFTSLLSFPISCKKNYAKQKIHLLKHGTADMIFTMCMYDHSISYLDVTYTFSAFIHFHI